MKTFTDLQQSKKLAEILPTESADMYYKYVLPKSDRIIHTPEIGNPIDSLKWYNEGYTFRGKREPITLSEYCIPCWSLAALLEEIPEIINFEDDESDYALEILKENGLYYLSYGNPLEHSRIEIEPQGYFVDACYEMILKLHELKML